MTSNAKRVAVVAGILVLAAVCLWFFSLTEMQSGPVGQNPNPVRSTPKPNPARSAQKPAQMLTGLSSEPHLVDEVPLEKSSSVRDRASSELTKCGVLELSFFKKTADGFQPALASRVGAQEVTDPLGAGHCVVLASYARRKHGKVVTRGVQRIRYPIYEYKDRTPFGFVVGRPYLLEVYPPGFNLLKNPLDRYHQDIGYTIIQVPESIPKGKIVRYQIDMEHQDPSALPKDTMKSLHIRFTETGKSYILLSKKTVVEVKKKSKVLLREQHAISGSAVVCEAGKRHAWLYCKNIKEGEMELPKDADLVFDETEFRKYQMAVPSGLRGMDIGLLYAKQDRWGLVWRPLRDSAGKPVTKVEFSFVPGEYFVACWDVEPKVIGKIVLPEKATGELRVLPVE